MNAPLVICATARLARGVRDTDNRRHLVQGEQVWQPIQAMTWAQWMADWSQAAMLRGDIPDDRIPALVLTPVQERILWEAAIDTLLANDPAAALFDSTGLAGAAMEAEGLLRVWRIALPPPGQHSEELKQFLLWRSAFDSARRRHHAVTLTQWHDQAIDWLRQGVGEVPAQLWLAGFDRMSPQEQDWLDAMAARGTVIERWPLGLEAPGAAVQTVYNQREDECRAAVAWARSQLAAKPEARIAIVVPELEILQDRLKSLLDDALHPETLHPAWAETPRCYDFSLGKPLANQPMVAAALALLRLSVQHYRIDQSAAGGLLRNPYWGQGAPADRARLEGWLRRKLPATISLDQWVRLSRKAQLQGLPSVEIMETLETWQAQLKAWPKKALPSGWADAFEQCLLAIGWPGSRSLSSHEYQALTAWRECLAIMRSLDRLTGQVTAAEALDRLRRQCQERVFQPEAKGDTRLLVTGLLESAAEPLDALWVMGMNDHLWPPPARPNALLPAAAQRAAAAPNASSEVQAEFAAAIHARLLVSARTLVFSCAAKDGERELRPSPLLAGMPVLDTPEAPMSTLAEKLAQPAEMEWLDDHRAPPLQTGEKVRGGAGLLRAQAICPAWAFYQYRLGARALDQPEDGLDPTDRGSLLHAVLQHFWRDRDAAWLTSLDDGALQQAIGEAVEAGMVQFAGSLDEALPPRFHALEAARLQALLHAWLSLEAKRAPFRVVDCERRVRLDIAGITVDLTLDRVDALADERLVVIDYKTGNQISHQSWAEERITEPQLPIYAALAMAENEVAAVCFAKVRLEEQKFIGIADDAECLPGVDGLDMDRARKLFPAERFPAWQDILTHWQTRILAIAEELKSGEASVRFTDEADLAYCEVLPLLRLPERRLQFEKRREPGA